MTVEVSHYSDFLKVSISSKLAKKNVNVVFRDEVPRIPVLSIGGETFHGANSIARFLFPPASDLKAKTEQWLLWDAFFKASLQALETNSEAVEVDFCLNVLDKCLRNEYLEGGVLTAADVCLWSTLYPVCSCDQVKKSLSNRSNVLLWIKNLSSLTEFKSSIGEEANIKPSVSLITLSSPSKSSLSTASEEALRSWEKGVLLEPAVKPIERIHPVLPKAAEKNVLITSALPYVNNVPHLGNIIGCVLSADVFSRFCRLRQWNTLYICGIDEYGTATETKALAEGLSPKEICDKYYAIHKDIYDWFNIDFDLFGRTTTQNQTDLVQQIFTSCHKNGYTTAITMDQLLCEKCDRYLADRFVGGICPRCSYDDARGDQCDGCGHLINAIDLVQPRCKQCGTKPVVKQSQQLFLDLPKIEGKLSEWVAESSSGWSHNAKMITEAWLKEGLKPRCITRDLKWGIPVPLTNFESKVFYVWFDAPIGYMSMTKTYCGEDWLKWWQPSPLSGPVSVYQFMAKDNVPFHSIMFPASQFATEQPFKHVNHLMATEYLNYEGGKFSKSRGIGVFGNDARDTGISADVFRFYLLYVRPEAQDSSFSWVDLATKNNSELLNNLGNFIFRSLMFSVKFFDAKVPEVKVGPNEQDMVVTIMEELASYISCVEKGKLRDGIKYIFNISRHGNVYIHSNEPWVKIKGSPEEREYAGSVVGFSCNIVCLLAVLLQPYMPETSKIIQEQVNFPKSRFYLSDRFCPFLDKGHKIGNPTPLFSKIEQSTVDELKAKYAGRQKSTSPEKEVKLTESGEDTVESLEEAITKQGDKVRNLKQSGAEKSVVQPEVTALLQLKERLAVLKGEPLPSRSSGKKKKK